MPPHGLTDDEERAEELPQDYSTPFSAPSGARDAVDDTHQEADTNVDSHEHYDEGIAGATEVEDPGNRGILGYKPKKSDKG